MNNSTGQFGFRFFAVQIITAFLLILSFPSTAQEQFTQKVSAEGEVLIFGGRVMDRSGNPLPDASVEIWQTDDRGVYDHPGDANTGRRDKGFQFFGTSVSDSRGSYSFRTILPGKYEPRPRHIHVKIRHAGRILLITQIYFSADGETIGPGGSTAKLRMDLDKKKNPGGTPYYSGSFDFIVDTGARGSMRLTDRQAEGPYYPVKDVSAFDNDLANY